MQIFVWSGYRDFFAQETAKHRSDGWNPTVKKTRVTNQRNICSNFVFVFLHKGNEAGRSAFFFAFKEKRDLARQFAMLSNPSPTRFHKCHQLALIVASPTRADYFPFFSLFNCRIKRIPVPQVQRINRLHIVVTIEKQMGFVFALWRRDMSYHHRMPRGVAF